ncbi:hypothetical protein LGM77_15490 [Burkholderia vietnamiensis]|uniref:hypothetical protein n=1 Tax=Burkholderia vietnamiensis TaxID=60552 RepID=UPI001592D78D|nr:hypothetical protein [Burkholderia vietnamiensis]MCA8208868.1 hypothetical protein [Burkholderia vietnamiensis]
MERDRADLGVSWPDEPESRVVDEKEPDLRFGAKASDVNVVTAIEVAPRWTMQRLEGRASARYAGNLCARKIAAKASFSSRIGNRGQGAGGPTPRRSVLSQTPVFGGRAPAPCAGTRVIRRCTARSRASLEMKIYWFAVRGRSRIIVS